MWEELKIRVEDDFKFELELRDKAYSKDDSIDNMNSKLMRMQSCNTLNSVRTIIWQIENNV